MLSSLVLGLFLSLATTLPLAWKWMLGLRRTAVTVFILSVLSSLLVALTSGMVAFLRGTFETAVASWALTLVSAFAVLAVRFYRDPDREVPPVEAALVSPADGDVLYIRRSRGGALPISTKHGRNYTLLELTKTPLQMQDAVVIGIGMSFLDVHVNRAPVAGRIAARQHFPGQFGSLRRPEMVFENERFTTVIERGHLQVAVVQIASRLVRQIVSFVEDNQEVTLGQRIGAIRLGSQVDLVLPMCQDLEITVQPGDRVTAGQSIVARSRIFSDDGR